MCGIAFALHALSESAVARLNFDRNVKRKLGPRGPDYFSQVHCDEIASSFYASVLHVRGDRVMEQPLTDNQGNVLCWNGEIFGVQGHCIDVGTLEDTVWLSAALEEAGKSRFCHESIISLLQSLQGPFSIAFYHFSTRRVYFGQDRFGRRSLAYHSKLLKKDVSNPSEFNIYDCHTIGSTELSCSEHATTYIAPDNVNDGPIFSVSSVGLSHNKDLLCHLPATGVYCLALPPEIIAGAAIQLTFHPYIASPVKRYQFLSDRENDIFDRRLLQFMSVSDENRHLLRHWEETGRTKSISCEYIRSAFAKSADIAARALLCVLNGAVRKRVRSISCMQGATRLNPSQARIAILFSGGIDSVVLAALAHFHLDSNSEPIDLLNVCFDEKTNYKSPDRLAAKIAVNELRDLFPRRTWRFVQINIPYTCVQAKEQEIWELIQPCDTHMDFNIGAAFYFLGRGKGAIKMLSGPLPPPVDIGRHVNQRCLLQDHLHSLIKVNDDNEKSTEHWAATDCEGNSEYSCIFSSCSVCCSRLQKYLGPLLRSNNVNNDKLKQTLQEALLTLGLDEDQEHQSRIINMLNSEMHRSDLYLCCAHSLDIGLHNTATLGAENCREDGEKSSHSEYTTTARVFLVGIGSDEQLAGYRRHKKAFDLGGHEALAKELCMDIERLWKRNMGRDDRCISAHGKEARYPFLDNTVVDFLARVPTQLLTTFGSPTPKGEVDKYLLRVAARDLLGLKHCTHLAKRAIQFGTRISKYSNTSAFKSNRKASGVAKYRPLHLSCPEEPDHNDTFSDVCHQDTSDMK